MVLFGDFVSLREVACASGELEGLMEGLMEGYLVEFTNQLLTMRLSDYSES